MNCLVFTKNPQNDRSFVYIHFVIVVKSIQTFTELVTQFMKYDMWVRHHNHIRWWKHTKYTHTTILHTHMHRQIRLHYTHTHTHTHMLTHIHYKQTNIQLIRAHYINSSCNEHICNSLTLLKCFLEHLDMFFGISTATTSFWWVEYSWKLIFKIIKTIFHSSARIQRQSLESLSK